MLIFSKAQWVTNFVAFHRYEEAREEEKLRSQREDFSDMVAEVSLFYVFTNLIWILGFLRGNLDKKVPVLVVAAWGDLAWPVVQNQMFMIYIFLLLLVNIKMLSLQNEKKRKRKMQDKEGKSKKKDFKF